MAAVMYGCAFHHTEVVDADALATNKVVFIYGIEDSLNIKGSVRNGLRKLGYTVTEDKSKADLMADFNYQCYWDVIHYTCRRFNFYITDAESRKILLHSKFWADTPFGPEKLVNDLLERVDDELKSKSVQPRR
jgi:hypothetical protein